MKLTNKEIALCLMGSTTRLEEVDDFLQDVLVLLELNTVLRVDNSHRIFQALDEVEFIENLKIKLISHLGDCEDKHSMLKEAAYNQEVTRRRRKLFEQKLGNESAAKAECN